MSFLGAVNYLSEFLLRLADMAEPLRLLTRKNEPFRWSDAQERAFQQLIDSITAELTLAIFDPNAPTFVTVDASDCGLGAQLSQMQNGHEVQYSLHLTHHRTASATLPPTRKRRLAASGPSNTGKNTF